MSKMKPWFIVGAVAVVIALWAITGYNRLITAQQNVRGQWADVEGAYQRRFDLVPNLVNTVKGASEFERKTFTEITEARSGWSKATAEGDRSAQIAAAQKFDNIYSGLRINVENYPTLNATQTYRDLMAQLEGTENRISTERADYNAAVGAYNGLVMRFPGNILANVFGFAPESMFDAAPGAETAPTVQFE